MIKFTARGHKSWRLSSAVLTFVKCAQPPIVYCCPTILGPIWPAQHSLHGDENKIEQTVLKQSFKPCRRLVFFWWISSGMQVPIQFNRLIFCQLGGRLIGAHLMIFWSFLSGFWRKRKRQTPQSAGLMTSLEKEMFLTNRMWRIIGWSKGWLRNKSGEFWSKRMWHTGRGSKSWSVFKTKCEELWRNRM